MGAPTRAVVIEVVHLRWDAHSPTRIAYRLSSRALRPDETADAAAAALATPVEAGASPGPAVDVLHSTSWRQQPDGGIVLTYAAVPDPHEHLPATVLLAPAVVCSGDPVRPAPEGLHAHHVAAHAVRHLTDLAGRDPGIATAATADGTARLWRAMADASAGMPTGTHREAHAAAEPSAVA